MLWCIVRMRKRGDSWPQIVSATGVPKATAIRITNIARDEGRTAKKAKRIWIDLDVDALDPTYAPAVHQPMPFGLTPMHLLAVIATVWSPKVVGFSISEYDPGRDVRDTTLNLLGWLMEHVLLKRHEQ